MASYVIFREPKARNGCGPALSLLLMWEAFVLLMVPKFLGTQPYLSLWPKAFG